MSQLVQPGNELLTHVVGNVLYRLICPFVLRTILGHNSLPKRLCNLRLTDVEVFQRYLSAHLVGIGKCIA